MGWSGESGKFPEQHQLNHIIKIDASAPGWREGYSGWLQLEDEGLFVVNYTEDEAPASRPVTQQFIMSDKPDEAKAADGTVVSGVPWVRGIFLDPRICQGIWREEIENRRSADSS
jgi:hypothetical protein